MAHQETDNVRKGGPAEVGAFGCNGKSPQTAATAGAALAAPSAGYVQAEATASQALVNQIRAALVAAGIMV